MKILTMTGNHATSRILPCYGLFILLIAIVACGNEYHGDQANAGGLETTLVLVTGQTYSYRVRNASTAPIGAWDQGNASPITWDLLDQSGTVIQMSVIGNNGGNTYIAIQPGTTQEYAIVLSGVLTPGQYTLRSRSIFDSHWDTITWNIAQVAAS